jgi:hypothetical protein
VNHSLDCKHLAWSKTAVAQVCKRANAVIDPMDGRQHYPACACERHRREDFACGQIGKFFEKSEAAR